MRITIIDVARRKFKAGFFDVLCERAIISVLVLTELVIKLNTLKVVDRNKVDDTGYCVRAVSCRGPAREYLDALDHHPGYLIDIRRRSKVG